MIVLASYCLNFLHPGYLLADVIEAERKAKKRIKSTQVTRPDWEIPLSIGPLSSYLFVMRSALSNL